MQIENVWQENALTVEGKLMHSRVDDPFFCETRRGVITARSVPVSSYTLGLSGICDVVEFTESPDGVQLPGRNGLYLAAPVEYKHGHEKSDHSDEAQLCAQAMCLEQMLMIQIPKGYLYYGETRRRVTVDLDDELRTLVKDMAKEMHAYFARGYTPRVKPFKGCRSCSIADLCLPELQAQTQSASAYIRQQIKEG